MMQIAEKYAKSKQPYGAVLLAATEEAEVVSIDPGGLSVVCVFSDGSRLRFRRALGDS